MPQGPDEAAEQERQPHAQWLEPGQQEATPAALQVWGVVAPSRAWTAVVATPVVLVVVAWAIWSIRVGDAGHRLMPGQDEDSGFDQRDNDRHWHLAGTVYLNRTDPALLVHQRVSMRWTLNLGHPAAWLILAALAVFAALALTGVIDVPSR